MTREDYQNPIDLAIQNLKIKVEQDESLPPDVRLATIADLASEIPHEFANLKGVLEGGTPNDQAGET